MNKSHTFFQNMFNLHGVVVCVWAQVSLHNFHFVNCLKKKKKAQLHLFSYYSYYKCLIHYSNMSHK